MSLTKEQQAELLKELEELYPLAQLRLGDVQITIGRMRTSENKMELMVGLDDKIDYLWGFPDLNDYRPETEQLWRKVTKAKYKPAMVKKLIKDLGKRRARKHLPDYDARLVRYDPCFNTAASLVRQYARIKELELVSIGRSNL